MKEDDRLKMRQNKTLGYGAKAPTNPNGQSFQVRRRVTNRLPCLNYGQNPGARSSGIRDNLLEKSGRTTVRRRIIRNIVCRQDQPSALLDGLVDKALDAGCIIAAFLQKKGLQAIQVDNR